MKYIYIEKYLLVPRDTKLEFFKFIGVFSKFKVIKQKVLLDDNSLVLELDKDSDMQLAQDSIAKFFKTDKNINVLIIENIFQSNKELVLEFKDNTKRKVRI
ncbi:MAG: hypothetical protein U9Q33_07210 [Campylobacterota bacterium]|nr:hypothetical protein [Campylobacterota bacterium]